MDPAQRRKLPASKARLAVLTDATDWRSLGLDGAIVVSPGRIALGRITEAFAPEVCGTAGIHPTAVLEPGAEIGEDASLVRSR